MPEARGLVLVVEDERSIADLLRLYLTREGFRVEIETDGPQALAAIRARRPSPGGPSRPPAARVGSSPTRNW